MRVGGATAGDHAARAVAGNGEVGLLSPNPLVKAVPRFSAPTGPDVARRRTRLLGRDRGSERPDARGNGGEQRGTAGNGADHCSLPPVPPLQGKWPVSALLVTVVRSLRLGDRRRAAASWSRRASPRARSPRGCA